MTTYKEAGVDVDAGTKAITRIKKHVRETFNANVLTDLGGFGGCFQFPKDKYVDPVLISSADGVGTKLKLAFLTNDGDYLIANEELGHWKDGIWYSNDSFKACKWTNSYNY